MKSMNTARKQVSRKVISPPKNTKKEDAKASGKVSKKTTSEDRKKSISPVARSQPRTLSVSTPKISKNPRPKKTPKKISRNILKEIKYYQNNIGFLIPRATIVRSIRKALSESLTKAKLESLDGFKFSSIGFDIMHESLENYLVCLLELSYMAAKHAKRVTLFPSDIRLVSRIRSC